MHSPGHAFRSGMQRQWCVVDAERFIFNSVRSCCYLILICNRTVYIYLFRVVSTQLVNQLEAAHQAQQQKTQAANKNFVDAERKFSQAERDINRFAETLEDVVLQVATIKELDLKK